MKMVNEIYINEITINCPYCGEPQDGFISSRRKTSSFRGRI
jgi:hypothetical protein